MERLLDTIIEPRLFVNVDFRAVTATAADLAHAVAHDPKRRPMPWLLLQLNAGDVVAEGMLEFALGAHAAVEVAVAFLEGADDQVALAVQRNGLARPVATRRLYSGMSHLVSSSFVPSNSSCQTSFQVLPVGRGWQGVLFFLLGKRDLLGGEADRQGQ